MLSPDTANVSVDFSSKIKLSHSSVFVIKGYIFNKKSRNKKRKLSIRPGDKTYDNKFIDPWSDSIVTVVKTVSCNNRLQQEKHKLCFYQEPITITIIIRLLLLPSH